MLSFIARMRRKPEGVRRSVAFFGALGMTAVIVLVWFISFIAGEPRESTAAPKAALKEDAIGPLRAFAATLGAVAGDTVEQFKKFKKSFIFSAETVYPASAPVD